MEYINVEKTNAKSKKDFQISPAIGMGRLSDKWLLMQELEVNTCQNKIHTKQSFYKLS